MSDRARDGEGPGERVWRPSDPVAKFRMRRDGSTAL
jgi:hypothetical protein